ncbi:U-scoloptoxin(16)-Cw1a-like [Penaeus chinensis]|uniref:U-scoloptoxin(16)-Cw1a-like n=1 Tax=Penaeus chinensis TaxID=139456 RepID=UPI001FB802E3|nr:U-scoloptoxin(16)-Cw1a-like [Penaeus chinensis]
MARIILLLLIVTLATVTQAGVGKKIEPIREGMPLVCRDETGYHPEGSTWYLKGCQRKYCTREGSTMITTHHICAPMAAPENCKWVEDETLNFPGCCPKPICP